MSASRAERAARALFLRAESDPFVRRIVIGATRALFRALVLEHRVGRDRLFRRTRAALRRFGAWRGPVLADLLHVDPSDMADLGRLQDFEDDALGVTGHWSDKGARAATKCETACPFADVAREMPALCTDLVHALETATFQSVNPRYRLVPLERLLSKGHAACEFHHRID